MSCMAQPWKHPESGVFYYRRRVPEDLRDVLGKREWKTSLHTRDLSEARPRFAAESAHCEEVFAAARKQKAGQLVVLSSDAPKLADRWARAVLEDWEGSPESVREFLADTPVGGGEVVPASDVVDEDNPKARAAAVYEFIRGALSDARLPLPPPSEPVWFALVDAFFARWCDLCGMAYRRHTGDWRSTLELPAASAPLAKERAEAEAKTKAPRLSEVFDSWATDKRQTDGENRSTAKTISEFGGAVTRFIELFGDLPVSDITRALCQDYRTALGKMPTKGEGIRGLSASELIARAERDGLPTASLGTVKKQLRALSAVLGFACRLGLVRENPVAESGIVQRLAKAEQKHQQTTEESGKGYSRAELCAIFSSALYRESWERSVGDLGAALYWMPLLMVYTGARREEVAQLDVADIEQDPDTGLWCMSIRPGGDKTVKTASSRRRVPLHGDLIALGLIDYRATVPASGRLFPLLKKHPKNGYGYAVGKAWAKYLREVAGVHSLASPAHGFRHAFKTLCRESGIPAEVSDWITGHAAVNVGATYGGKPLARMAEELGRFPSVARMAGLLDD